MTKIIDEATLPETRSVEAHLLINHDGTIAGTVRGLDAEPPTDFYGWLELMDAIESIRSRRDA